MTTNNPTPTQQGETLEPLTDREFQQMEQWAGAGIADPQPYSDLMKLAVKTDVFLQRALQEIRRTRRAAVAGPPGDARKFAEEVVGTVFDNTGASHETLKATMIERIADAFAASSPTPAERAGWTPEELTMLYPELSDEERQRILDETTAPAESTRVEGEARIPSDFITATGELKDWNTIGRVVNINTHGEPTRARLREIETSVSHGYEREYRKSGWSKALQFAIRDLHFLLTFFRDDVTSAAPADNDAGSSKEVLCACRTFNLDPHLRAFLDCCDFVHTVIACPSKKVAECP